ncbi:ABC transporter ATP-binding protein [Alcaligenaceae bacterium C4P045]|nr:ABC transporter ATP-binding protein [Alcaligenaceae bacterium C4P045]
MTPVLAVDGLTVELNTRRGRLLAIDDVSFSVDAGETLAIVGESGCGKSLTALALMGLLPTPPARIAAGQVRLAGRDLLGLSERAMQAVRGRQVSMIFQDPMSSLNPVMTVGDQLIESLRRHAGLPWRAARRRALELLEQVNMPDAERRMDEYPHRLSGGMCQRVMIAMAISCEPQVLIADEPTTALDVTIQAQILDLLRGLQQRTGLALILITHDLGVVAEVADRVAVMYAGRKVEEASVATLFSDPQHPYTQGLLRATPSTVGADGRLADIPGMVPQLADLPHGCAFADRCAAVQSRCRAARPPLTVLDDRGEVACVVAHDRYMQRLAQPYPEGRRA